MSFNKRYIHKGMILDNINNISYIKNLVNADSLVLDSWSKKFFDNFNFKNDYQRLRDELNNDTKFSSNNSCIPEHKNFNYLKSTSNILINLKKDPLWIDVILAFHVLEITNIEEEKKGLFKDLVEVCIERINSIYTN